jgi:PAS domain-containing protein
MSGDDASEGARATLQAALEASLDAFYVLRCERNDAGEIVDFVFTEVNRFALQRMQKVREELIGQRLCELYPSNRSAGFFARYRRVVETHEPLDEEYMLHEGRGSLRMVPAPGGGGGRRGCDLAAQDQRAEAGAARARGAARAAAARAEDGIAGAPGGVASPTTSTIC